MTTRAQLSAILIAASMAGLLARASRAWAEPVDHKAMFRETSKSLAQWKLAVASVPPDKTLPRLVNTVDPRCKWQQTFRPEAVRAEFTLRRDKLIELLDGDEQAALRAYVRDELPLQTAETTTGCAEGAVVVVDSIRETQVKIDEFVGDVSKSKSAVITLEIASTPAGAVFSFSPKYKDDWQQVSTNTRVKYVWRGKYRYTVRKDGYLPVDGERSLMDGSVVKVSCALVKEPPPGAQPLAAQTTLPLPCNFQ
jgi:hypothetical protein